MMREFHPDLGVQAQNSAEPSALAIGTHPGSVRSSAAQDSHCPTQRRGGAFVGHIRAVNELLQYGSSEGASITRGGVYSV